MSRKLDLQYLVFEKLGGVDPIRSRVPAGCGELSRAAWYTKYASDMSALACTSIQTRSSIKSRKLLVLAEQSLQLMRRPELDFMFRALRQCDISV